MAIYAFEPDYAVHPGATLKETLDDRSMPQAELALRAGLSDKAISQIINGVAPISFDTAIKLERVFGIPARFWNNLQRNYQESVTAQSERDRLTADLEWLKTIPIKELVRRRYLTVAKTNGRTERAELLHQVLSFFGVSDVEAWRRLWQSPAYLFRRSKAPIKHPGKVAAWLRLGEIDARSIRCSPYSARTFQQALQQIRALTVRPPDAMTPELVRLCATAGVAVVFVAKIPGAGITAATRWLSKDKALIQLSDLHGTDDVFWFAFFHEAGHLLEHGKKQVFLEGLSKGRERDEREADAFARNMLIPPEYEPRLKSLRRQTPLATKRAVRRFAKELQIAPSIVTGRLQHDGIIPYSWCKDLKRKVTLNRAFREAKPGPEGRPKTESG